MFTGAFFGFVLNHCGESGCFGVYVAGKEWFEEVKEGWVEASGEGEGYGVC